MLINIGSKISLITEFIKMNNQETTKIFYCSRCHNELFDSDKKFDSGTGFPSFWNHIGENVKQIFLNTYGRQRIQLVCNKCGLHLGHLFPNKTTVTKLRYCIMSEAIV